MPILTVGFVIVVTLITAGAGLAIVWVGLPVLVAGLHGAGALATADLHVRRQAFGTPLPPERHAPTDPDTRPLARLLQPLRDPQAWRDVLWVVVSFIVSIITWSIALTWVVGIIAGLGSIIVHPILEAALGPNRNGLGELLHVPFPMFFDIVTGVGLGVLFLLTLPRVIGGLTRMQTGVSDLLIAGPAHDRAENERLRTSRSSARKAETDALRRLERDLHDGPSSA